MTTKAQMDEQREHYRKLISCRDDYRMGRSFTTLDVAKWIGRDKSIAYHYLSLFEQQGYVTRDKVVTKGNSSPHVWRKAGSNRMRMHFKDWSNDEV